MVADPEQAWERIGSEAFDTVVMDARGADRVWDLLRKIRLAGSLPVIIITESHAREDKRRAMELGASDLLNGPFVPEDLRARVASMLRLKGQQDAIQSHTERLDQTVESRTSELEASQIDVIWRLGKAAELRDEETGNHVVRVGCYSRTIADAIGLDRKFSETLFLAAPLHDIGKIGVPDAILRKPGKLDPEEWVVMRKHCAIGAAILQDDWQIGRVLERYGGLRSYRHDVRSGNPIMTMASEIALCHHEKWDGSGYPRGTTGDQIPIAARIVAICDMYDALRSERPYKSVFSEEKSLSIITEGVGRHHDPEIYGAFMASFEAIHDIEKDFSDQSQADRSPDVSKKEMVC